MKNILIVSPHFYPNNFKCNDVAFELAKQGHKVTVLTDIPNYPGESILMDMDFSVDDVKLSMASK